MTLGEQQRKFARLLPRLIDRAHELGFEVTIGEVERHRKAAEWLHSVGLGTINSLHLSRLAVDLHLFREGQYLATTEAHRPLGEWWEQQDPDCRWGGRFKRADGNHYSLAWQGRA